MTKEELYEEFKNVTHFDDTKIPGFDCDKDVARITSVAFNNKVIISDCEGISILLCIDPYCGTKMALTYFHKEGTDDRHSSGDS